MKRSLARVVRFMEDRVLTALFPKVFQMFQQSATIVESVAGLSHVTLKSPVPFSVFFRSKVVSQG
jgi:hypothetical protein